jgi:hypothetical protein
VEGREAEVTEEGWYSDPYRVHEQRWFSDGSPTVLVRDHGTTRKDPPPDGPYLEAPRHIESPPDELRRTDDDASVDPVDAAWSYFTRSSGGF